MSKQPLTIPLTDGSLALYRGVWSTSAADALMARLLSGTAWQQHVVRLFGRRVAAPRLSAWHGDPLAHYGYSGVDLSPQPWSEALQEIREVVQSLAGRGFNSVLLNRYRDGSDSMGWHSDDEPELGASPWIASVSLGAERAFRLRHKRSGDTCRLMLPHGSVLVMAGDLQRHWQHCVPKTRRACGTRINLTFRQVVESGRRERPGAASAAPGARG